MSTNKLFTMSHDGTQEYCCNIIKIEELYPIEGSDFLAKTYINGESIVVRKDQVHVGEVYFYASNECELSEKFLSANNLFDSGTWEKNSNAEEVRPIKDNIEHIKKEVAQLNRRVKDFMKARRCLEAAANGKTPDLNISKSQFYIRRWLPETEDISKYDLMRILVIIKKDQETISNDEKKIEELRNSIKKYVGFFNKYGRVKCIKLKGIPSYGYIFSKEEVMKVYPEVSDFILEDNIGLNFDTVCDELFVKAYIPRIKERPVREKSERPDKKVEKLDRMIPGEFKFHYDTNPLGKNMDKFEPNDIIVVSMKCHGTSGIFSNCKVKFPIKLPFYKKFINFITKCISSKYKENTVFPTYYVDYDEIYSSRKVIKNKDINPNCKQGYYSTDVWGHWAQKLHGLIPKGMTIYAEIAGYEPGDNTRMIQSEYDYGCEPGKSKLMPYRITTVNENSTLKEWNVEDVYNWTVNLMVNNPELAPDIMPIDILYHGKMKNMYPKISTDDLHTWRNAVLLEMQNDTELFGMELEEPLCKNNVPREGLVIRKDDDEYPEAFKLKSSCFKQWEKAKVDAGIVDSEMLEGYSQEI